MQSAVEPTNEPLARRPAPLSGGGSGQPGWPSCSRPQVLGAYLNLNQSASRRRRSAE